MTEAERENLIAARGRLIRWAREIDRVVQEIAVKGTASATISAGGGSKSYTHLDLGTLRSLREEYASRVAQINRRLSGANATGIRRVMVARW